jgi:prepilin-type N-terminal cleavage/methylation domain-containing protein
MTNKNIKREDGFTIIEVLIVLAIAGLIMLIVFLAVPALQRNARNTSRKSDASSLASALAEYINNNDGQLPASCTGAACAFISNWKPGYYTAANVTYTNNTSAGTMGDPKSLDNISIGSYLTCGTGATAEQATGTGASSRSVAIVYDVETGGGGTGTEQCITAN